VTWFQELKTKGKQFQYSVILEIKLIAVNTGSKLETGEVSSLSLLGVFEFWIYLCPLPSLPPPPFPPLASTVTLVA
jgi:hypothetical protein